MRKLPESKHWPRNKNNEYHGIHTTNRPKWIIISQWKNVVVHGVRVDITKSCHA
jgi:hypothetical protein